MNAEIKIEADSTIGRCLIALRAGPSTSGELSERLVSMPSLNDLQRRGLVVAGDNGWRLTDAGRKACPLRNPLAGELAKVPPGATTARAVPLQRLPTINNQLPARKAGTTGGVSMNETASNKKMNAPERVLHALADCPQGISRKELLLKLSDLSESLIDNAICRLVKANKVERPAYAVLALAADRSQMKTTPAAVEIPVAVSDPALVLPEAKEPHAVRTAEAAPAPEIDFSVYADGRLAIIDSGIILVLPNDATQRLGYFLGCFEIGAGVLRLAPQNDQVADAIRELGMLQRELKLITADMNAELAAVKESYATESEPRRLRVEALTNGLQAWIEAPQSNKNKAVAFPTL